jgi:hypothetical protein
MRTYPPVEFLALGRLEPLQFLALQLLYRLELKVPAQLGVLFLSQLMLMYPPLGFLGTGEIGVALLLIQSIVVLPAGVEGTGEIGTCYSFCHGGNVSVPTGVSGTGQVGSVTTTANANVFAVGVSAIGYIGFVTIWGRIVPNPNTVNRVLDTPLQSQRG